MEVTESLLPLFSYYYVSPTGKIYTTRYKSGLHQLKPRVNNKGYARVLLKVAPKKYKEFLVHRIVATLYINNKLPALRCVVNHKNGNKLDNRVENLEWTTVGENVRHAHTGKSPKSRQYIDDIYKNLLRINDIRQEEAMHPRHL